jgi:hypothetical protein
VIWRLLLLILVPVGILTPLIAAEPLTAIDRWSARDFIGLNDGDAVGSWTSLSNRTATASVDLMPQYLSSATPAHGAAIRFDRDWLKLTENSPVGSLLGFSIAVVFRADEPGAGDAYQWYGKSGIVDAEQGGVTRDWGVVIDENGRIGLGIGSPDTTVYSASAPSLADGNYHVAVATWGDGFQSVFIDNRYADILAGSPTAARNNVGLSIGAIHTGENGAARRFVGEIAEVRFYRSRLSTNEVASLIQELIDLHLAPGRPFIRSFTVSTNQVQIGSPVILAWDVADAESIQIEPVTGTITSQRGTINVYPRTNTTYTLTASNALAVRTAQVTVQVDQGIPLANNQSLSTQAGVQFSIVLTGADPQGASLTYRLLTRPEHGVLDGMPPRLTYTPEASFIGLDQFMFDANDGEFNSSPATVSIQVLPPPTPPSAVVLSTTNLSARAAPGWLVASLRARDVNAIDTHSFELVSGQGDNDQFVILGNQLRTSSRFVGGTGATYHVWIRVTDSEGLWLDQDFVLTSVEASSSLVINEVNYHPPDPTIREEFIELFNPTQSEIDLSNWRVKGGINFSFSSNCIIPPGGYLVLAEAPETLQVRFGVEAVGPWQGNLASEGENIILADANGQQIDEVSYRSEFPWPIAADGEGGSMALVNPGLDNNLGSSWRTENPPTPGRANGVFADNPPPNIRQVRHSPVSPNSTNRCVVTAKVTDPEGVSSVRVQYQIVAAGDYLPSVLAVPVAQLVANSGLQPTPNPAFTATNRWITVPMLDAGTEGDELAGDDVYTAVIPPQANRTLVRYRIVVTDLLGASRRAPFEDDPSLNFALFTYDGVPAYQGTSAQALAALPIYFLLAREQDISQCTAYNSSSQLPQFANNGLAHPARFAFNWPGSLVYNGVVYDHIRYRLHGANGRYQPGKRNWRFELNRGHYLAARDQNGQLFPRKWAHLTTGKGSNNRLVLTFGLNEAINYFLWNQAGVPAPRTFFFHFRVVDGAIESPDVYNGDFWGLNWAQEDYDGRFLDAHQLAQGNLYKLINAPRSYDAGLDMVAQQRYQGAQAVTNGSDGTAVQNGLLRAQTSDWIRAHVDCAEWFRYHAICEAVRNYDFWPDANKNAAWYFAPPYSAANDFHGRFLTLPWDTDSTWGPTWNSGQDLVYNGIFLATPHPDLQIEYANTVRELRDLLFQPDQINPVIDAFASQIRDFAPADLRRWTAAPASSGNYNTLSSQSGFISPGLSGGVAGYLQDLKNFMFAGGSHPWWLDRSTVAAGGWITRLDSLARDAAVPKMPVVEYAGPAGYPATQLLFRSSAFNDPQGAATFAAMQWRVAEITPTNVLVADPYQLKLEWHAVWDSGELSLFTNQAQVPAYCVQPDHVYRARVRHKDTTGRWSSWSAPVQFSPTSGDLVSMLQRYLVVSEIMYHPVGVDGGDGSNFEFIELQNTGPQALDLSGLTFTSGFNYSFVNDAVLSPGQYLVLARNAAILATRYPELAVYGVFTGKLGNAGEPVRLGYPHGAEILSVAYRTRAPWPAAADGFGFSLVPDEDHPGSYRASSKAGGSPGIGDPTNNIPRVVINEVLARPNSTSSAAIELFNPGSSAADLGGWFLTDDPSYPGKYRIPEGTMISANGYLQVDETQFNATPGLGGSFSLNGAAGVLYLFSANEAHELTGYSHGFSSFGAQRGETVGRYVNSVGEEQFPPQIVPTLGAVNQGARVGPVVISEICYLPTNSAEPFVELLNVTSVPVPLYDPDQPTNTWRLNGLGVTFPPATVIPAQGILLLVASAADAFRTQFSVPSEVLVLSFAGQLQTNGETLELLRPDSDPTNRMAHALVDRVRYGATSPWPLMAGGRAAALQRVDPGGYGDDPINWQAASPTPGTLQPASAPRITIDVVIDQDDKLPVVTYAVPANRGGRLQFKNELIDPTWTTLMRVPMKATNQSGSFEDAASSAARYYRIISP